jgi:DNA invertase Pin-like site-specific DNA recombinase
MTPAVAYFRTSSAANVGEDKDSEKRQRIAVEQYAKANDIEIVATFYDAAVSGADLIQVRPGFSEMLDRIEGNGVRTVLVEHQDRFARDMEPAVLGLMLMKARDVTVLDCSGSNLTSPDDPMQKAMMQIGFVFSELEKTRLVQKLKSARDRKSAALGRRCEGRKGYSVTHPEMVREAKRLYRKNPRTGKRRSLRKIAVELLKLGYARDGGLPFNAVTVKNMVAA